MSKRLEQIKQIAESKANELSSPYQAFVLGAHWADSHPVTQWHKVNGELPPRKSEDSHISLVVIVSDGFDFEKAYYNYFYGTWMGNNITPLYWIRLLKPEE